MPSSSLDHAAHMQSALDMAHHNLEAPFGSVLVDQSTEQIVARGVNQSSTNPTLHGEISAINDYVRLGGTDWPRLTLYTTAEPCCMCQGAILWSGIGEVVFGASIAQLIELGWKQIDISAQQIAKRSWRSDLSIIGGICGEACNQLFRTAIENQD